MQATSCAIPVSILRAEPWSIPWGGSIYAKVQAYNSYGDSFYSILGNGAVIFTEPDAPYDLIENPDERTFDQLSFSWTAGALDGGTAVLSYRVWYD
jgi:hypothetical protein